MIGIRRCVGHTRHGLSAIAVAMVVRMLAPAGSRADDSPMEMFSFSGFGTLGLVHSSEPNADFVASSTSQASGTAFSHSWSADVDSRLGVQLTGNFGTRISAVVQVISEQRSDNTFTPHVEWANVKYQVTPDLYVRAGRIALPSFLVADYRKVGYANPWVRPPIEVYGLVPVTTNDGMDASYRLGIGQYTNTVQVTYGQSDIIEPSGAVDKARRVWGVSGTVERGALTVRGTYQHGNVTVASIAPLFDAFRQFGPEGIALAEKYDSDAKPFDFIGIGGSYDTVRWFAMGEWGSTESHSALGKRSAWYLSGGYRFGKFTPYVTYAEARALSNTSDPGLNAANFPPQLAGVIGGLNDALNALLRTIPVQRTISIGGRWDFTKNADLKLQYEHIQLGTGSAGTLSNTQPAFQPGGTVDVFSATVDFLFRGDGSMIPGSRARSSVVALALSLGTSSAPADVVAVVSSKSSVTALSQAQVADIFLGKGSRFPNGEEAVPIDQVEGSGARDEFYTKVTGKSAAQIKAHWAKIIFTGRGRPPREVPNSLEVKKEVAQNPRAIGYIERSHVDGNLRVLLSP